MVCGTFQLLAVNVKEFISPSSASPDPFGLYGDMKFSAENSTTTSELGCAGNTIVKDGPGVTGLLSSP